MPVQQVISEFVSEFLGAIGLKGHVTQAAVSLFVQQCRIGSLPAQQGFTTGDHQVYIIAIGLAPASSRQEFTELMIQLIQVIAGTEVTEAWIPAGVAVTAGAHQRQIVEYSKVRWIDCQAFLAELACRHAKTTAGKIAAKGSHEDAGHANVTTFTL